MNIILTLICENYRAAKEQFIIILRKNKVTTGPDFLYHIYSSSIERLTDNKSMVIGGSSIFDSGVKYDNKLPNVYSQIISVKK